MDLSTVARRANGGPWRRALFPELARSVFAILLGACAIASLALRAAVAAPLPASTAVGSEILINGAFLKGSGNQPDNWRTEAWIEKPEAVEYSWTAPANNGPGELRVFNKQPDDARWTQAVKLASGWYRFSAEIRCENVPTNNSGASISVLEDGIVSEDLHGSSEWKRVGFYLKVGPKGANVDVALRLGGYGSLNTGRAFFRNASVVRIEGPPPEAARIFDLTEIRKASASAPIGSPLTLVVTFLLGAILAAIGWRLYGQSEPAADALDRPSRAERRRVSRAREPR